MMLLLCVSGCSEEPTVSDTSEVLVLMDKLRQLESQISETTMGLQMLSGSLSKIEKGMNENDQAIALVNGRVDGVELQQKETNQYLSRFDELQTEIDRLEARSRQLKHSFEKRWGQSKRRPSPTVAKKIKRSPIKSTKMPFTVMSVESVANRYFITLKDHRSGRYSRIERGERWKGWRLTQIDLTAKQAVWLSPGGELKEVFL